MVMLTWYEDGRACFCTTNKTEVVEAIAEAVGDFEYKELKDGDRDKCDMRGAGGVADVGMARCDQQAKVKG